MITWAALFSTAPLFAYAQDANSEETGQDERVAVIAHPGVSNTTLSSFEASELYRMERNKWDNGDLVVLVDLVSKSATKLQFYKFIDAKDRELKRIWMRFILSGEGRAPAVARSEADVLAMVASTEGAIGYINAKNVTDQVKILVLIEPENL